MNSDLKQKIVAEAEKAKKEAENEARRLAVELATEKARRQAEEIRAHRLVAEKAKKETEKKDSDEHDRVKRFEFKGIKYLKSTKNGTIYNMEQDIVGKWNEETQNIDFNENSDSEEDDEDDYSLDATFEKGDKIWYHFNDGKKTQTPMLKEGVVAAVHFDDFPNLYFTIKLNDGKEKQVDERRLSKRK